MKIPFFKYHGTGNDFIIIDNREENISLGQMQIQEMCDRHFGIGADGLILLQNSTKADFKMVYYNKDGLEGSLCGNGGRCIVAFAKSLHIFETETKFEAVDGIHEAAISSIGVKLKMNDVSDISIFETHTFIDTGSPHHVEWVVNIENLDIVSFGRQIAHNSTYGKKGSNVNFVEKKGSTFTIRTYERGVEDETFSCGTGAVAAALSLKAVQKTNENKVELHTKGGTLKVSFVETEKEKFNNIYLEGPTEEVFSGTISI